MLAGTIGDGADTVYEEGVEAFASILNGPLSLGEAIARTENLLKDAAERSMRMIQTGMAIRAGQRGGGEGGMSSPPKIGELMKLSRSFTA